MALVSQTRRETEFSERFERAGILHSFGSTESCAGALLGRPGHGTERSLLGRSQLLHSTSREYSRRFSIEKLSSKHPLHAASNLLDVSSELGTTETRWTVVGRTTNVNGFSTRLRRVGLLVTFV